METSRALPVTRVGRSAVTHRSDWVVIEEPLEIRVARPPDEPTPRAIAVTMRTPGHDEELALGFLVGEGVVRAAGDVQGIHSCPANESAVRVDLAPHAGGDLERLRRSSYVSSSCGVCGRQSIEAVFAALPETRVHGTAQLDPAILIELPNVMRSAQQTFQATGGLHAVALFTLSGELVALREDVGRHNAMDKLVGHASRAGRLPLTDHVVILSGRASFELLQKALAAGVSIVASVGAPSSLAVDLAERAGITLAGFVSAQGFNLYAHGERLAASGTWRGTAA